MASRSQYDNVVIDVQGNALDNIQVTVNEAGTENLATIYSQRTGGSTIPNPFVTDEIGLIQFWAEPGLYDIEWHDLNSVPRIGDRFITWSAVSGASSGIALSQLDGSFEGLLPAGLGPLPYTGDVAPSGWLLCDGSEVSRVTYSTLFSAIGTKYGTGNGSTTFNLPDARGRPVYGAGTHSDVNTLGDSDGVAVSLRTPAHSHTDGTLATDSHSHGAGSFSVNSHSHTVASHTHGVGSYTGGSHSHTVSSHSHGAGSFAVDSHSHTVNSHSHDAGSYAAASHSHGGSVGAPTNTGKALSGSGSQFSYSGSNHDHSITASAPGVSGSSGSSAPGTSGSSPGVNGTSSGATASTDSANPSLSGTSGSAAPSTDSVAPGISGTSASGTAGVSGSTGSVTSPYLVTNMIIKT
jgi:microcystin-dependent protein